MENLLNDQKKFMKVNLKDDTLLSFAVKQKISFGTILEKFVGQTKLY